MGSPIGTRSPGTLRSLALFFLLVAPLIVAFPARALAAGSEQTITTHYFTIIYPQGEEQTANWYASFADDVDVSVSDLLGASPLQDVTLHIYSTEAEYTQANPLAENHPGILAHSIPDQKEIGVAVERLRQQPPEVARDSFRHEMTHVIAGALSNQQLPVGFQEGLAQYNELSESRSQEVVQAIRAAQAKNVPLLSWTDLNDIDRFRAQLEVAYPESYTVMAFLADRYGMGKYARFLEELRQGSDYQQALLAAYGKPVDKLQSEWQTYLPDFLVDRWQLNLLSANDLGPGIALYDAGRFSEAKDVFSRSQKLYSDLGREDKLQQATEYLNKATQAAAALDLADQARKELEAHDYVAAQRDSSQASQTFTTLNLPTQLERASGISQQAGSGLAAIDALKRAGEHLASFTIGAAQSEAQMAGQTFAGLGDAAHVTEANQILSILWLWERIAGLTAVVTGGLAILAGVIAARPRRRRLASPIPLGKEHASWL